MVTEETELKIVPEGEAAPEILQGGVVRVPEGKADYLSVKGTHRVPSSLLRLLLVALGYSLLCSLLSVSVPSLWICDEVCLYCTMRYVLLMPPQLISTTSPLHTSQALPALGYASRERGDTSLRTWASDKHFRCDRAPNRIERIHYL